MIAHRRPERRRRRRAFMILNMLIALGLLSGFVIAAERLFRLTVQTTARAALEEEDLIRLEQAIAALRADVWHAAKVDAPDPARLVVTDAKARTAPWQTEPSGDLLLRTRDGEELRWTGLGLEFERQGQWVVVRRRGAEVALLQRADGSAK